MSTVTYGPAAILDITSYGYKSFFRSLKHLAQLASPGIALFCILGIILVNFALQAGDFASLSTTDSLIFSLTTMAGVFCLFLFWFYFLSYVTLRYAHDKYSDSLKTNLWSYLAPDANLFGIVGLCILYSLLFIAGIIILFILGIITGALAAIHPALAVLFAFPAFSAIFCVYVYGLTRLQLIFIVYINQPKQGIMAPFKESWRLTKNNFWRAFGLGFIMWLFQTILAAPLNILVEVMKIVIALNMTLFEQGWMQIVMAVLVAISLLFTLLLQCSSMFVHYRFYLDLKARKDHPELVTTPQAISANWNDTSI